MERVWQVRGWAVCREGGGAGRNGESGEGGSRTAAETRGIVLEVNATEGEGPGLGEEEVEFSSSLPGGDAALADIGDAVPVGVGFSNPGPIGEVGAEAIGGAEAGTLAKEHEADAGAKDLSHLVLDGDAAMPDDDHGSQGPTAGGEQRDEGGKQLLRLDVGGEGGKAVRDDDGDVACGQRRGFAGEECPRLRRELAAEVRALEILRAVAGGAGQDEGRESERPREIPGEGSGIKGGQDGIAGAGVGEQKIEALRGEKTGAGAADGDPGGREIAQ